MRKAVALSDTGSHLEATRESWTKDGADAKKAEVESGDDPSPCHHLWALDPAMPWTVQQSYYYFFKSSRPVLFYFLVTFYIGTYYVLGPLLGTQNRDEYDLYFAHKFIV